MKRLLLLAAAGLCTLENSLADLAQYQAAVQAETSLVSYYTFEAGNASDSVGSNHGTLQGSPTFTVGIGNGADKALTLNGNQRVNFGVIPAFEFSDGTGSVEAWVKADWAA